MAKFDASSVEQMEYDFTRWKPASVADDTEWSGVVPEPSQEAIVRFFEAQQDIALEQERIQRDLIEARKANIEQQWVEAHPGEDFPGVEKVPDPTVEQIQAWNEAERQPRDERRAELRQRFLVALAAVCGGSPSLDVLQALPYRQLQGFSGWLSGQFSPEGWAADTAR